MAYQFAFSLNALEVPCVVATPDGKAPDWFSSSVTTVSQEEIVGRLTEKDNLIFSLPHDYERIRGIQAKLVYHCVGTDPLIDPILQNRRVTILTAWPQAYRYAEERGRNDSIDVHAAVSSCFFYDGSVKMENTVAYMPRRGLELAQQCRQGLSNLQFCAIEGCKEENTAHIMKSCEFYLATAEGEWFGLPALEAMAAGCVVVSVPVVGGMDYLSHKSNARVVEPRRLKQALSDMSRRENHRLRSKFRDRALATASEFRINRHIKRIKEQLNGPLSFMKK